MLPWVRHQFHPARAQLSERPPDALKYPLMTSFLPSFLPSFLSFSLLSPPPFFLPFFFLPSTPSPESFLILHLGTLTELLAPLIMGLCQSSHHVSNYNSEVKILENNHETAQRLRHSNCLNKAWINLNNFTVMNWLIPLHCRY